ncbi:hypothetical protein F5Y05DRAFT_422654 [Hypoxylon sp. FL0543]|nr:hypothetical protein F5Y05DRAFT_422654 [Hypoxylon sp. FL0543]
MMDVPTISLSDPASSPWFPVRCPPESKSSIERTLDGYFQEIKDTINSMANEFLRIQLPYYQDVSASWGLQRVLVDSMGTVAKPHPFISAANEGDDKCSPGQHIYNPVITIPLPCGMQATDKRVLFLRDALLYDETYAFRTAHGIPLRENPFYNQFTLEFTNPIANLGGSTCTLWCPSTRIFLPDPKTFFSQGPVEFLLNDTWEHTCIWDWAVECNKYRAIHEGKETSEVKEGDEGMDDDGEMELPLGEPENMDMEELGGSDNVFAV